MFLNITDPIKASYEVEDPEYSMVQLAQTSTRGRQARPAHHFAVRRADRPA